MRRVRVGETVRRAISVQNKAGNKLVKIADGKRVWRVMNKARHERKKLQGREVMAAQP